MMGSRRRYYDWFSPFYDGFVRMHSGDQQEKMRDFLVEAAGARSGETVVDLCTGTGSSALRLARTGARVVGIDLSAGMLRQARRKSADLPAIQWVQADVRALPVASGRADRVTCAYAMYELTEAVRRDLLEEVVRVLRPGGKFVMMEHLPPAGAFLQLLYRIRIHLLGSKGARSFVGSEAEALGRYLGGVGVVRSEGGKTKAVFGFKPVPRSG
jgi:ubiquinone/menaquinone biosynthesis C-methylase UbiE